MRSGSFARKRLPMRSSACERLHHGNGVVRKRRTAMSGSADAFRFLLSGGPVSSSAGSFACGPPDLVLVRRTKEASGGPNAVSLVRRTGCLVRRTVCLVRRTPLPFLQRTGKYKGRRSPSPCPTASNTYVASSLQACDSSRQFEEMNDMLKINFIGS